MTHPRGRLVVLIAGFALIARQAPAQDFTSPAMAGPSGSALRLIEQGLPGVAAEDTSGARAGAAVASLEASATRWFGLPELTTRAAALELGWRSLRAAGGLSQTGDPELGWNALGLGVGATGAAGGAALRAVARRDRDRQAAPSPLGPGVGVEVGGGAWVGAGAIRVWADAPQLWTRGAAPPLVRPLEIGAAIAAGTLRAWWSRRAAAALSGAPGAHAAGLGVATGRWSAWLEANDRPLRGGIGVSARAGPLAVAGAVDDHPLLGETVRCSIRLEATR